MANPFHLSFVVPDIQVSKDFYLKTLGCSIGRDNETWFDILFFGHQITIHQASENMKAYSIDHFGPILTKAEWLDLIKKCQKSSVNFLMKPLIKNQNQADESGKFLINDPSFNILEFKYYLNFNETVAQFD